MCLRFQTISVESSLAQIRGGGVFYTLKLIYLSQLLKMELKGKLSRLNHSKGREGGGRGEKREKYILN